LDIGFTLDPSWIDGKTTIEFVAPFVTSGMNVLEFVLHSNEEGWTGTRDMANEWVSAGRRCHIHAPYRGTSNPERFATSRRAEVQRVVAPALKVTELLATQGKFAPDLVIHGAGSKASREELWKDTLEYVRWVLSETRSAQVALEVLPPRPINRIGDNRDEVLAVLQEINDPRLSICWDLGHDAILGYKEMPAEPFLKRVRHVHVHDVNATGDDHYPLMYGFVAWQKYLSALDSAGFNGAVTLELNRERTTSVDQWYQIVAQNLAALSKGANQS
jgi:sugar phosphate isomerase/epimerase